MSESDSFISEVTEEVRRERLYRWLKRYGWIGVTAVVLVIGAAGLNEWRKARATAAAQAAGDALRAALAIDSPEARAAELEALAGEAGSAATAVSLARAGSLAEAGEPGAAAEVLAGLAADADVPGLYRDLARLQRVMLLGPEMEISERLATLEGLIGPDAPFAPLALEQRALARLEAGEIEQAHADLRAILDGGRAPQSLAARARQLIAATGGASGPDPAAPAVVDDPSLAPADG